MRDLINNINSPVIRTLLQYSYLYPFVIGIILGVTKKAIRLVAPLIILAVLIWGYMNWDLITRLLESIRK